jgi:anti-sigma factor RsiW
MHGQVDGELDLAVDLEVQRHIEECPRCASEYAALRAMRTRVKDEAFRFEAPAALKEKIRRAIPASPPSRRPISTRSSRGSTASWISHRR